MPAIHLIFFFTSICFFLCTKASVGLDEIVVSPRHGFCEKNRMRKLSIDIIPFFLHVFFNGEVATKCEFNRKIFGFSQQAKVLQQVSPRVFLGLGG